VEGAPSPDYGAPFHFKELRCNLPGAAKRHKRYRTAAFVVSALLVEQAVFVRPNFKLMHSYRLPFLYLSRHLLYDVLAVWKNLKIIFFATGVAFRLRLNILPNACNALSNPHNFGPFTWALYSWP